ncbi:WD40-repeat-containing domain protein [Cokeromyces recurvatus]|uniref:WD40-repeat-containing domain protein n=1 Tax=Cokeromyces recurvatus TaxID=90255 RepID=UPI00221EA8D6|nr:WD40-repeat-containing domain protein [Cokeromyces recurvatus]KAI7902411.1 WD40-repeat-containing domain protein [Cokeromyces recurvatus]
MHVEYISCVCFPDSRTLVTGGTDNLVCIWKVKDGKDTDFILSECLKGHNSVITSIAASRSYSVLVTGSADKTAIIWDLNRKQYIRSLAGHENGVQSIDINETTGDIITCSGHVIRVWTINGDLYLTKSTCPSSESILSCLFYERRMFEWSAQDLIITGHKKGLVKFWLKRIERDTSTGKHKWGLDLVHQLYHHSHLDQTPDRSDIVCLSISKSRKTLFTGSKHGRVYAFVLPDTSDTYHLQREDKCKECMMCNKAFSVLERKNHCKTCGGIFCTMCLSNSPLSCPDKSARFCKICFEYLSPICNNI